MKNSVAQILTVNCGSSSLKFALFSIQNGARIQRDLSGRIDGIGTSRNSLHVKLGDNSPTTEQIKVKTHSDCVPILVKIIDSHRDGVQLAIGHRIVHGGERFKGPERVSAAIVNELSELVSLAPQHLPQELEVLRAISKIYGDVPQLLCFDTAFHHNLPLEAQLLPIPRKYFELGVRRYGFHGLSYSFLVQELERIAGKQSVMGKVVLAHLGNGSSMAALRDGVSVDTTMAFTPAAGMMMGSRCGDLDPGLVQFLMDRHGIGTKEFSNLINFESGLLGVSETTSDVRELLARESEDIRAKESLSMYCRSAAKSLAAMAVSLSGLDTIVFAGGIGENSNAIRGRICSQLKFLGIDIDNALNDRNADTISSPNSKVSVRVIRTDEELFIARNVHKILLEDKQ